MLKSIQPHVARMLFSQKNVARRRAKYERKRLRNDQPHRVTVYLRINDPHSYLLLQVLPELQKRYQLAYDFRTVLTLQSEMYPAPNLWSLNAFNDCAHLAELYADINDGLTFPQQAPKSTQLQDEQITAQLLHYELQENYLEKALPLFHAYWNDSARLGSLLNPKVIKNTECYQHHLCANEALLKNKGHYLTAMLHYAGEWYWGFNRLQYLEKRLNELKSSLGMPAAVVFDRSHRYFCNGLSQAQIQSLTKQETRKLTIEMTYSARSPYSYLGLIRAQKLAQHYQFQLEVKPVLPMLMRRMQVPKRKGHYIIHDVCREAEQYDIPFGFIADPLGKGVENTYALFDYAQSQGLAIEFLTSAASGAWAYGIRADTDRGLAKLVTRAGLEWQAARPHLQKNNWRSWAQSNLAELYSNDQWGVPCFKFNELVVFGQDRLDRIEQEIANTLRNESQTNI